MKRRYATAMAVALSLVGVRPAFAADPVTDFLNQLFGGYSQKQHWTMIRFVDPPARGRHGRKAWRHSYRYDAPVGGSVWRASYYGGGERLNAHTANGERFRAGGFTAAHRTLPMGTRLSVCFHGCAVVRINDRGPAAWTGRSLDLARGAASAIGLVGPGSGNVRVAVLN